jgi:RimJ/RimL family protein N-acetyltransferase
VEVGEAIEAVRATGNLSMIVLQCTAAYPAPLESIDAMSLVTMREIFGVPTGLSDHSRDAIVAPMTAVALGATVIEKHYTLSNRLPGPDHPFALEPHELVEMVRRIRDVEKARGKGEKQVHGVEEELRAFARRTVFTTRAVAAGEPMSRENTAVLRAGKLAHGLPPRDYPDAMGQPFANPLPAWATVKPTDVAAKSDVGGGDAVSLRLAEERDAGRVWVWNNEPKSRQASVRSLPIPWSEHARWYRARLVEADTSFWIAETAADGAIGSVRIERRGDEDQISLALTPGARGRGLGARVIAQAVAARRARPGSLPIVALVKPENAASGRAFVRAGFVPEGQREVFGIQMDRYVVRFGRLV